MDAQPYHNEPGYEKTNVRAGRRSSDEVEKNVSDYNDTITHETIRVAVIEMLQERSVDALTMPAALKDVMVSHFKTNFQFYENLIQSKLTYDGKPIRDPHNGRRPETFNYKEMLKKIVELNEKCNQTETTSIPIYHKIAERTLLTSNRDEFRSVTESYEESMGYHSDDDDGSALYESESDVDDDQPSNATDDAMNLNQTSTTTDLPSKRRRLATLIR